MYIEQAYKGDNSWWKYLIGITLVVAFYLIGQMPFAGVAMMAYYGKNGQDAPMPTEKDLLDFEALGIAPWLGIILIVLTFIGILFGLWLAMKTLHQRPFKTLLTSRRKFDWSRVWTAVIIWLFLTLAIDIIGYLMKPDNYVWAFDAKKWIPLLIAVLIFIPFQTSAEELLMRGYLLQAFGLLLKNPLPAVIITAILFGALHGWNPENAKYGYGIMMAYYIGFGLFMALIAVMDDGLEIPLAVHGINNIYGATMVSYPESALNTPALFQMQVLNANIMFVGWLVMSLIFFFIMSKKYKWSDWGKLTRPIKSQEEIIAEAETGL